MTTNRDDDRDRSALDWNRTVPDDRTEVALSEERLRVGAVPEEVGDVRIRKSVDTERIRQTVDRGVERPEIDREGPLEGDTGEVITLPDGAVSIPVFEEVLVVEKRRVVRERVIVRKITTYEEQVVEADLGRERVEIDVDDSVRDRVFGADDAR